MRTFIPDTSRIILICCIRMRAHKAKSAWDKNFGWGKTGGGWRNEKRGCAPHEMFRFVLEPLCPAWFHHSARFSVLAALELPPRPRSAFLISATFSMRGLM